MAPPDPELMQTLAAIQQALAALTSRVEALESGQTRPRPGPATAARTPAVAAPELDATEDVAPVEAASSTAVAPDVVLVIAAAVAAYLGERAHVRQIRLISSSAWGQQGRVTVQASHALHR